MNKAKWLQRRLGSALIAAAARVLWLGLSSMLWAQGTAYLTGYVLDPSAAAVPNALVRITLRTHYSKPRAYSPVSAGNARRFYYGPW